MGYKIKTLEKEKMEDGSFRIVARIIKKNLLGWIVYDEIDEIDADFQFLFERKSNPARPTFRCKNEKDVDLILEVLEMRIFKNYSVV